MGILDRIQALSCDKKLSAADFMYEGKGLDLSEMFTCNDYYRIVFFKTAHDIHKTFGKSEV